MSRRVWWWWAYNEQSASYVRELGFPDERITRVQNSIDTVSLMAAAATVTPQELASLRRRLGLRGDNVCIFVGGMYEDKRLPFLVAACELVRKELPDFEMIFVGDGPQSGVVSEAAKRHGWIHYVGARFDDERVPYMLLAKLALMPLVGLGVLDSFALRVPLITTDVPYHGPEVEYLESGVNGLIVACDCGPGEYAAAVVDVLRDTKLRETLRRGCERSSSLYTVEAMVDNFAAGIHGALGESPPPVEYSREPDAPRRRPALPQTGVRPTGSTRRPCRQPAVPESSPRATRRDDSRRSGTPVEFLRGPDARHRGHRPFQ